MTISGEIAAGDPIEAYQEVSENMSVPELLAPSGDAYVLRVRGDSMIEDHICSGDYVLIKRTQEVRDGDIVVALVKGSNGSRVSLVVDAIKKMGEARAPETLAETLEG